MLHAVDDCRVELFLALRDSLLDEARHTVLRSIRAAREQKQDPSSDDLKARDILKRYDNGRSYSCVEEDDVDGCMSGHVWPQTSTQDDDDADGCLSEAKKKKKMSPVGQNYNSHRLQVQANLNVIKADGQCKLNYAA